MLRYWLVSIDILLFFLFFLLLIYFSFLYAFIYQGIAKKIVLKALSRAAKRKGVNIKDMQSFAGSRRRQLYKDIAVVVLHFDLMMFNTESNLAALSVRSYSDSVDGSRIQEIALIAAEDVPEDAPEDTPEDTPAASVVVSSDTTGASSSRNC